MSTVRGLTGTEGAVPSVELRRVADAQDRFDAAIEQLDDAALRKPSSLPGWTVGHVLSHVARNADSHLRRTEAAARGLIVEQYPGGREGREAEIVRDASRPASELVSDVHETGSAVVTAWASLPGDIWANTILDVFGRKHQLSWLPGRRWQELEIHLTDLGIGITYDDWPDEFVIDRLAALEPSLVMRLPAGVPAPSNGTLTKRQELAWIFGRFDRPDLPRLESWE